MCAKKIYQYVIFTKMIIPFPMIPLVSEIKYIIGIDNTS